MKHSQILIVLLILFGSCIGESSNKINAKIGGADTSTSIYVSNNTTQKSQVEVLYMHGKQRCATCIAIGTEAEAFIKSLGNDKVIMRTVDFSTSDGEKIADKYEIASSSLIVVRDGKVDNITAMSFQYARNNPELFKKNLDKSIQKMLK